MTPKVRSKPDTMLPGHCYCCNRIHSEDNYIFTVCGECWEHYKPGTSCPAPPEPPQDKSLSPRTRINQEYREGFVAALNQVRALVDAAFWMGNPADVKAQLERVRISCGTAISIVDELYQSTDGSTNGS
jgi:hypothetical protein